MAKSETTEVHHKVKAQGTYLFLSFFSPLPSLFRSSIDSSYAELCHAHAVEIHNAFEISAALH